MVIFIVVIIYKFKMINMNKEVKKAEFQVELAEVDTFYGRFKYLYSINLIKTKCKCLPHK